MAGVGMFGDLPSIHIDGEYASTGPATVAQNWPSEEGVYAPHQLSSFEVETLSFMDGHRATSYSGEPTYSPPEPCQRDCYKLEHDLIGHGFHLKSEDISPWAPSVLSYGYAPSLSSDGMSLSDEESFSGTSLHDPLARSYHLDRVPSSGSCGQSWSVGIPSLDEGSLPYYSPTFPETSAEGSDCASPGIALPEIQQYPDVYHETYYETMTEAPRETKYPQLPYTQPPEAYVHLPEELQRVSATPGIEDENSIGLQAVTGYSPPQPCHDAQAARPNRACKSKSKAKQRKQSFRVTKAGNKLPSTAVVVLACSGKAAANTCPHCSQSFQSKVSLQKHVSTAHTRPFTCTFRIYGCCATFGSKNEWKRHVSSQHLRLGIWRCDLGSCLPAAGNAHDERGDRAAVFNDFNRKDLFTQHLRRMHAPPEPSAPGERERFNASLESTSRRCLMDIRSPPPRSVCGYCGDSVRPAVFEGTGSWEARMEHVGRHLESGHEGPTSWREDVGLREWMYREGLIRWTNSGWRLVGLAGDDEPGTRRRA